MNRYTYRWIVIALVMLQICCVGCSRDIDNGISVSSDSAINTVSIAEAKEAIEDRLPAKPYVFYVEFQREETIEKRDYYYFLVYTLSEEPIIGPDGPFYQQYTYAWIYVDSRTGDLYEMPPTGTGLIAWP